MIQSKYGKLPGEDTDTWRKRVGKLLKQEKEEVKWEQLESEATKVVGEIRKRPSKPNKKDYYGLLKKYNSKYSSKQAAVEAYKRDKTHWNNWEKSLKK